MVREPVLLAFDPGSHLGYAVFSLTRFCLMEAGVFESDREWEAFEVWMARTYAKWDVEAAVVEEVSSRVPLGHNAYLYVLEHLRMNYPRVVIIKQMPARRTAFMSLASDAVRDLTPPVKASLTLRGHAIDATAHGFSYIFGQSAEVLARRYGVTKSQPLTTEEPVDYALEVSAIH